MDFPAVEAQLNDLPNTFKRNGPPYTQLIDSFAAGLTLFTLGADATAMQVALFGFALDGWLDVWGLLFNIPRNQNEANAIYGTRIARTVLAWVGTVPAIQAWMNFYTPGGVITENFPNVGYTMTFPSSVPLAVINSFLITLNRIRPAGVPFIVLIGSSGLFLGTEEFTGQGQVAGSYLTIGTTRLFPNLNATTLSFEPILPTLYLVDPTLNPSLAP